MTTPGNSFAMVSLHFPPITLGSSSVLKSPLGSPLLSVDSLLDCYDILLTTHRDSFELLL